MNLITLHFHFPYFNVHLTRNEIFFVKIFLLFMFEFEFKLIINDELLVC